jgi:hypothetical protein
MLLIPVCAFMACYRVKFTFTFTSPTHIQAIRKYYCTMFLTEIRVLYSILLSSTRVNFNLLKLV